MFLKHKEEACKTQEGSMSQLFRVRASASEPLPGVWVLSLTAGLGHTLRSKEARSLSAFRSHVYQKRTLPA